MADLDLEGATLHDSDFKEVDYDDSGDDDGDDDFNDLSRELDQIGKINISYFLDKVNFNLPNFDIKQISVELNKQLDKYKSYYKTGIVISDEYRDSFRIMDSLKELLNTRLQIKQFSTDVKSALEKLQPLTEVVHRAVSLPVEDLSEFEDEEEEEEEKEGGRKEDKEIGVDSHARIDPDIRKVVDAIGLSEVISNGQEFLSKFINQVTGKGSKDDKSLPHYGLPEDGDETASTTTISTTASSTTMSSDRIAGLSPEVVKDLTELDCMSDFKKEEILRAKILAIQQLNVEQLAKNQLMTKLMMGNYYKFINQQLKNEEERFSTILEHERGSIKTGEAFSDSNEETDLEAAAHNESEEDEVIITERDQEPTFYDAANSILGCSHYQRSCKSECPTCHKWFTCPFCHDAKISDHKMVRNQVKHILCMHCSTPQDVETSFCVNCEKELANYFCDKCVLYDDDPNKEIYHCDKCGICRLGLGLDKDYFHCDTCNICLSIDLKDKHKCVSNTTHCNCAICSEYLFTSTQKVVFMKCGHSIHQLCYDELVKHSYKCPICKKSIANVENRFRLLDQEIAHSPMPEPYNTWSCTITCNDCKGKSNCQYHVLGLKCKYCHSYNTNQVKIRKPNENAEDEVEVGEGENHDFDVNIMRAVETNLQSNFGIDLRQN
ncbi:uncharacterized protein LODBEIA_P48660 [Lodderomyces beijingensis]|uniref:Uncharacterized protein n=1 Tax=Lodderomyces beijingensis TaxID=1775926 RepID=A0ABP0ZTE2_9ASCO